MDSETTLLVLANRSFLYSLLARGFAEEPDAAFLGILAQDHSRAEVGLVSHELTSQTTDAYDALLATARETPLDTLRGQYVSIFVGPGTCKAYPWETVHLSDTKSLFQPELLPIRETYRAAGFLPAHYPRVQDDFIGLELDFLAKLAAAALHSWESGDEAATHERLAQSHAFLEGHLLRWVDSLSASIAREYGDGFYATLARLTACIARRDCSLLG